MKQTNENKDRVKIFIFMALMALALNLRSPMTSLPPIISQLQAELQMNSTLTGLLTTIPILCFGLLTPFASQFIAKAGMNKAIIVTLVGVLIGTIIRSIAGIPSALIGTVILGASITVGNIVSTMVIARDFSHRSNMATGAYTSALNIGTMLTSALTAPLAILFGWRFATSFWGIFAVLALVMWAMVFCRSKEENRFSKKRTNEVHTERGNMISNEPIVSVWKRKTVWLLVITFAAHLFLYYAITAWLPSYFMDTTGMDQTAAGVAASAFQICALVGAFGVPIVAATGKIKNAILLTLISSCWVIAMAGLLFLPALWMAWAFIGGIAQGGCFTVVFMIMLEQSYDVYDNRKISSIVQGFGYSVASLGPIITGNLYEYFEGWSASFVLLFIISLLLLITTVFLWKEKPKLIHH